MTRKDGDAQESGSHVVLFVEVEESGEQDISTTVTTAGSR